MQAVRATQDSEANTVLMAGVETISSAPFGCWTMTLQYVSTIYCNRTAVQEQHASWLDTNRSHPTQFSCSRKQKFRRLS